MNPLTADNNDGRVLLALRAGPMTPSELNERGLSVRGWLIKAGYVEQVGDYYRITEAGRAACPFRNPLAATVVAPAKQEFSTMVKEAAVSRNDVLAAIVAAGAQGIGRTALIDAFAGRTTDKAVEMHLAQLNKALPPVIFKPERGRYVAIQFNNQEAAYVPATPDEKPVAEAKVPAPLLPEMEELQAEQIEIKGVPDRRGPVILGEADETDIGIFSNGRIEISDAFHEVHLSEGVVRKLRAFLGLFQEAA